MLNPVLNTYLLGQLYFDFMPQIIEAIGRMRGLVAVVNVYPFANPKLDHALGSMQAYHNRIENNLSNLIPLMSQMDVDLRVESINLQEAIEEYDDFVERLISQQGATDEEVELSFSKGTALVHMAVGFNQHVESILLNELQLDRSEYYSTFVLMIVLSVILQLALIVVSYRMSFSYLALNSAHQLSSKLSIELSETLERQEQMFAIIGHELRTPAAALNMLLDDMVLDNDSPTLTKARATSSHLLAVLDDMKLASSNGMEDVSQQRTISVFDLIQNTIESLSHLAEEHGVSLSYTSGCDTDAQVTGSPKIVRQIVTNLIKNAIIHGGGEHVWVDIKCRPALGESLSFSVTIEDDGKGIPEGEVEKLFQAYSRGDTVADGTGLGMFISRELARSLPGGDLTYSPRHPNGARFKLYFDFPLLEGEGEIIDPREWIEGKRILLAEDTELLRLLTTKVLEQEGAIVVCAGDGREALELAGNTPFDFVLTDIFMPRMNGFEFVQALRESGFDGAVYGVTGATVGKDAQKLIESGADAVIPKPISLVALSKLLKKQAEKPIDA